VSGFDPHMRPITPLPLPELVAAEDESSGFFADFGEERPPWTQARYEVHCEAVAAAQLEWDRRKADWDIAYRDRLRRLWASRGVPIRAILAAERPLPSEASKTALAGLDGTRVLSGTRGVGKTVAAVMWLLAGREPSEYSETREPRFIDGSQLARWPRYDDEAMTTLELARALVIDDLGVEYADQRGSTAATLDALVNARYSRQLPTMITTNLPAVEFKARYGERVADRIRESGSFTEICGKSMRGRK